MMMEDEFYFGEPPDVGRCQRCGQTIYEWEDYLYDTYNDVIYCCEGCILDEIDIIQVTEDSETDEKECLHCATKLTDEYESIMFKGDRHTRWCDLDCFFAYAGIERV